MPPDAPPDHRSLDSLAATAKATLLAHGEHPATFVVDGSRGRLMLVPSDLPAESIQRQLLAYTMAAHIPANKRRRAIGELLQVAFIAEAWGVTRPKEMLDTGEVFTVTPRLCADRVELLTLTTIDARTDAQAGRSYEMLRTPGGAVHDLLRQPDGDMQSNALLEAFLAGWRGTPAVVEGA